MITEFTTFKQTNNHTPYFDSLICKNESPTWRAITLHRDENNPNENWIQIRTSLEIF
jgi:hypothetical protein